jgi:hypothetical protein
MGHLLESARTGRLALPMSPLSLAKYAKHAVNHGEIRRADVKARNAR